jgi:hypothetical protein
MSRPILIEQKKNGQGSLLDRIVRNYSRREVHLISSGEELYEVTERQNYFAVYFEPRSGSREQLDWLNNYPGYIIGVVNRKVNEDFLKPFIESGMDDFIYKPYQPERIGKQINNREAYISG